MELVARRTGGAGRVLVSWLEQGGVTVSQVPDLRQAQRPMGRRTTLAIAEFDQATKILARTRR